MKKISSIILILLCLTLTSCSEFAIGVALGQPVYEDMRIGATRIKISKGYNTAPQKNSDGCYVFSDDIETFVNEICYVDSHSAEFEGQKVRIKGISWQENYSYHCIGREYSNGYYYYLMYYMDNGSYVSDYKSATVEGTVEIAVSGSSYYCIIRADKVTLNDSSSTPGEINPNLT